MDIPRRWVRVLGKGDKERRVPLDVDVAGLVQTYLLAPAQLVARAGVSGRIRADATTDDIGMLMCGICATGDGADLVTRFQVWLREAGRAASTVRTYATVAGEFVAFVDTRGGLAGCGAGAIEAFVAALAGYQFKTVEQKLCAVRSFLRFACVEGLIDAAVLDLVPAVKSRKQTRIPSVWDPADVAKILDAIDRGNPCGKRDYAIKAKCALDPDSPATRASR